LIYRVAMKLHVVVHAYWEFMDIAAAQIDAAHGNYDVTLIPSRAALFNYDAAIKVGEAISLERGREELR
jgi:hypothetical protein